MDNNCFDYLIEPEALMRFRGNLKAADWRVQISEVNVLEAIATTNDKRRDELITVIRKVGEGGSVLRWPFGILKELGQAITEGKEIHRVELVDLEPYLYDRDEAIAIRAEAAEFNRNVEAAFAKLHDRGRSKLRKQMREKGIADIYGSPRDFLDVGWADSETRQIFAEVTWQRFGLAGTPPMDVLDICEPWRILLDTEGFAMYERAIAAQQPKRVGRMDLIQLVYLGLAERRMMASADAGLLRAANAIFPGRYSYARAIHIADLI